LLLLPIALPAQVVRGRVTETNSGVPLAGVVVELLSDSARARAGAVLSAPDGGFALRAPAPGRYVLSAKRIGVRRTVTAAFDVAAGETVVRDMVVDAVVFTLPEMVVTGLTTCDPNATNGARLASLWEEARTALFATQLSLRDQLFRAHVTRYVRELEPRTNRVLSETRSEAAGVVSQPFMAVDAESLSAHGYQRSDVDGRIVYFGPDANVLLSDAFLRDHCFRLVSGGRSRRGLVGLGFAPVEGRTRAEVVGTLWLDERTFELRFVEFAYTVVPSSADSANTGGEVHFSRLDSGAWIIRRWFIRLPVIAKPLSPLTIENSAAPWVLVRPMALRYRQEGGEVAAEELLRRTRLATVRGQVRDSSNQPLAGAVVRVAGTRLRAVSAETGTFVLDSVPDGAWALLAETPGYDSLGVAAADTRLEVTDGRASQAMLRALNASSVVSRLCLNQAPRRRYGVVRVTVRGSGDSVVRGLPLAISWSQRGNNMLERRAGPRTVEGSTDQQGRFTLCDVDAGVPVSVVVARVGGGAEPVVTVTVPDRGFAAVVVQALER
jgi:hypothetical protein